MPNPTPDPELLRSLGKLTRGLSALFWGLPVAFIVCAETARLNFIQPFEIVPALATNVLLLYGLWQMSSFQKQERPWRHALDRAKIFGLVNFGLCPFLYWFNQMPGQDYFRDAIFLLVISAMLFLFNLNVVIKQLGAMLPDETLRHDVNLFTALNRWMLTAWMFLVSAALLLPQFAFFSNGLGLELQLRVGQAEAAILLFFGVAPLAITMALIWKTKEVIFDSVFGAK
jgi:hypothetical protein